MADETAYIGSVTFDYPLIWLRIPPKTLGADVTTRDGTVISVTPASISQDQRFAKLRAQWITWDQVEALRNMAAARSVYNMQAELTGETYRIRFAAENGFDEGSLKSSVMDEDVNPEDVLTYATDLWDCNLNVIILADE